MHPWTQAEATRKGHLGAAAIAFGDEFAGRDYEEGTDEMELARLAIGAMLTLLDLTNP